MLRARAEFLTFFRSFAILFVFFLSRFRAEIPVFVVVLIRGMETNE